MDSTALVPALRKSAFLKRAANVLGTTTKALGHAAPSAAAVTAVGAGTDWDPAAMTAAGLGTAGLGHPLAGLAKRVTRNRATGATENAGALQRQHAVTADLATAPVKDWTTLKPRRGDSAVMRDVIADTNATGRADAAGARGDQRRAQRELPGAAAEAEAAARKATTAQRVATGTAALAPAAAAGTGIAVGASDTGQAAGATLTDAVGAAVRSAPSPDYLQIAKDYMPVVAAVGAVGALAMWLMSRDDEDTVKTAAAPESSRAFAARNRRRIERLLARNPKALDNIGTHAQALHDLPITLDAAQKPKLAAALNRIP